MVQLKGQGLVFPVTFHSLLLTAVWGPPLEPPPGSHCFKVAIGEDSKVEWVEKPRVAMHLCDIPKCLNPLHLAYGTYKENRFRGEAMSLTKEEVVKRRNKWWMDIMMSRPSG